MALRSTPRDLKRADRKLVGRDSPATDLAIVRADGSRVWDARGRSYVDFRMGWCCGNLGWRRPEIRERVRRWEGPDYVDPSCLYAPWAECAALLARMAPGALQRSYRAATGTEAVEQALQIARAYTGRDKLLGIEDSYHGNSLGVKELIRRKVPAPDDAKVADRLETQLKRREYAAFVMEPVITALGVCVPDAEFMARARALCTRYGTLFVVDEVATGFGRTGTRFAIEHFGVEPDVMCVAKAFSNGCAPIAATITTAAIADAVEGELDFYSTFGWHPLSVEVAIANLRAWERDGDEVLANVAARSEQAAARLASMGFDEVRVKGLAIGLDVGDPDEGDALVEACQKHGLLISAEDGTATLFPALTIDEATLDEGLDVLARCARP